MCRKDNLRTKVARIVACKVQEEGRTLPPPIGTLRLSRIFRTAESPPDPDAVPLRQAVLWSLFAIVLVTGLVLYFKYERLVVPLLT